MSQALRPKAIIIGSSDVIKLCTIRAVGEFGYDVDVIHYVEKNLLKPIDFYSKYVKNAYIIDKSEEGSLVRFLLENYTNPTHKPIIFTLDDFPTFVIDNARETLKDKFLFSHLTNGEGLVGLMDKHLQKNLAEESGFNVVKGWPILYEDGTYKIPVDIKYPCFIKGLYSYHVSKRIQRKCNNAEELLALLEDCKKYYPFAVYAEEFIEINKEFGVIGACNGEEYVIPAKAEFVEMGRSYKAGVSLLGHVMPLDSNSDLLKKTAMFLSKLHYVGLFNIDFIESNGRTYFVELNLRFAAYGYGVLRAGVNLPAICINYLMQNENHLKGELNKDCYYMNEKAAFSNVLEKGITMKEYKAMKRKAGVLLIADPSDPKPNKGFRKNYLIKYLKLSFMGIMHR